MLFDPTGKAEDKVFPHSYCSFSRSLTTSQLARLIAAGRILDIMLLPSPSPNMLRRTSRSGNFSHISTAFCRLWHLRLLSGICLSASYCIRSLSISASFCSRATSALFAARCFSTRFSFSRRASSISSSMRSRALAASACTAKSCASSCSALRRCRAAARRCSASASARAFESFTSSCNLRSESSRSVSSRASSALSLTSCRWAACRS
mmetsp:Transcript_59828/g.123777  ORF Transcript_59828/g.123777 Transcript_59828/m.123777 type:complete len:208 (-) Transcript_59828:746-1369(-)